ncbi:unnamed protein product, partial [Ixodes hexagonus]
SEPLSLSSTVREDVNLVKRATIVGINLIFVLVSIIVLWASFFTVRSRQGYPVAFWWHLFTRPLAFTIIMHFEVPMIIGGALAVVTSSFGFLGALRENTFFLAWYNRGVAVCIVISGVGAIALYFFPTALRNYFRSGKHVDFIHSYRDSADLQNIIDRLQVSFRCCGISDQSFRDWDHNRYFSCDQENQSRERCSVPASCCRVNETTVLDLDMGCGSGVLLQTDQRAWETVYTRSCGEGILAYLEDKMVVFLLVCVLIITFLCFVLITSMMLKIEVQNLEFIYDKYYSNLIDGQERMKRDRVSLPPVPTRNSPLAGDHRFLKLL